MRDLLAHLRPRSFRARIAIAISAALAVAIIVLQLGLGLFVQGQVQGEVERNLQQQAQEVAGAVARDGVPGAIDAERFLPGTSMTVRQEGMVIYWTDPVRVMDARATAQVGDIQVTLEREAESSVISAWVVPVALGVGLVGIGVLVWFLAGRVSRRLRGEAGALAAQAERVAAGDLSGRAPETGDELGRVGAALNRMTERLAEADDHQRVFLADVAHELRTPVTAIDGFATALADGTARTDEDRAEAAEFIRSEAARLRTLVGDLQRLTVLDLEPAVDLRPADLAELARTAVARLAGPAGERGVALEGPGPGGDPLPVVTDAGHVETVLANLLTNALRATPRGGRIRVTAESAGGEALLAVRDTGRGIPPEHLPRLFDRLYRVEPGRQRDDLGGSGLGLAIVQRLAELLGGRITVESEVGRGSCFTLHLPAPPAPVPAAPDRAQEVAHR